MPRVARSTAASRQGATDTSRSGVSATAADAPGPRRSRNAEVARLFDEMADMLEVQGEQAYRVRAYRTAARSIAAHPERLETLFAEGRLREIRGVGPALEARIVEYLATGRVEAYDQLAASFPPGLAALLGVPHLGPAKARAIYERLGISSLADLEGAARSGLLTEVPGFGDRAAQAVVRSIEGMQQRTTRNLISDGWRVAQDVMQRLAARGAAQVAVAGSLRRMQETAGNVDLVAAGDDASLLLEALADKPDLVEVLDRTTTTIRVVLYGGIEVRLWVYPPEAWGTALVWHTGSAAHVERLERLAAERGWSLGPHGLQDATTGATLAGPDEAQVYARLGLQWVPPELREDNGEIEAAQAGTLPRLIEVGDLRGDLHCHSDWTDGVHSLEEMARAAKARGYDYMALTDHSQALRVARGLSPERLAEERRLVDRLNHTLAPFVVLLGTEMDILWDGRLDFSDEVLATLDYVSASIHSGFRQPREVMTARIVRAIRSPYVHTLNHPHGRILRRREPYAVDMAAVAEAAAEAGCALEINAQPDRLDLDGPWARRALAAGARFTISSDAHSTRNLALIQYGIGSARRGWLTAADVLNTLPLPALRATLAHKHRAIQAA